MQYLGGKRRIGARIAAEINARRATRSVVWEPFCGGLGVTQYLGGPVVAGDVDPALIELYKALQRGWDPPSVVSEAEYQAARRLPDNDPLKAFIAYGCSYGGKRWGGYARSPGRNYAAGSRRALLEQIAACTETRFECVDFFTVEPSMFNGVAYFDPPYRGVTGYTGGFDHDRFEALAHRWGALNPGRVIVSEYAFQGELIAAIPRRHNVGANASKRPVNECLWVAA